MSEPQRQHSFDDPIENLEQTNVQEIHAPIMRELADPRDGFEPINPGWTVLFGLLLFWGGWYLGKYGGDFSSDVYDERRGSGAASGPPAPLDPLVLGSRLYAGKCSACHQPDGNGRPGQFPPLTGSDWVTGSPGVLARILIHGPQGEFAVNGSKYNGNMPAFGGQLNDEQIAAVLSFIRKEWGNNAAAVVPDQIAAVRKATAGRTTPWTEAELKAVKE